MWWNFEGTMRVVISLAVVGFFAMVCALAWGFWAAILFVSTLVARITA